VTLAGIVGILLRRFVALNCGWQKRENHVKAI
jgi:hypothetical protein